MGFGFITLLISSPLSPFVSPYPPLCFVVCLCFFALPMPWQTEYYYPQVSGRHLPWGRSIFSRASRASAPTVNAERTLSR